MPQRGNSRKSAVNNSSRRLIGDTRQKWTDLETVPWATIRPAPATAPAAFARPFKTHRCGCFLVQNFRAGNSSPRLVRHSAVVLDPETPRQTTDLDTLLSSLP